MLHSLLAPLLNPLTLIETAGLIGVFAAVFVESGLFFGFFLPGDSLLFTAGFLASQHFFTIWYLAIGAAVAAIAGDAVGYWFGASVGPRIFAKDDSRFFKRKHVERARDFYKKYGPRAVVFARFVPVVRTFVPILAGVGEMNYRTFATYNSIGGAAWAVCLSFLGYFLGATIPNIDHYLLPIIVVIIILSFLPILFEYLWTRHKENQGKK